MSAKLKNKLNEVKKDSYKELQKSNILGRVDQLLLDYDVQEAEILKSAGFKLNLNYEAKLKEDYNRTAAAEKVYNRPTFTGKQIRELCQLYDLKLLPTSFYRGNIDSNVAAEIDKFCNENKLPITNADLFILAPASSFETVNKIIPKDTDPILFYRTDKKASWNFRADLDETFSQICNWGNDFTELRKYRFLLDSSRDRGNDQVSSNRIKIFVLVLSALFLFGMCLTQFLPAIIFALVLSTMAFINFLFLDTRTLNDQEWNTENTQR